MGEEEANAAVNVVNGEVANVGVRGGHDVFIRLQGAANLMDDVGFFFLEGGLITWGVLRFP